MQFLIRLIFWVNAVVGLPLSGIGLFMAYGYITRSNVSPVPFLFGVALVGIILSGWWLLYGYGRAAFRRDPPIVWRAFWWTSFGFNLAIAAGTIGFSLFVVFVVPHDQYWGDALALFLSGTWPLLMALASRAVLVGEDGEEEHA